MVRNRYYISNEGISYQDCTDKFGIPVGTIKERGALEKWNQKRVNIFTTALSLIEQRTAEEIKKRNIEHIQIARAIQLGAVKAISSGVEPKSARDVKEWLMAGVTLERQALGMDKKVYEKVYVNTPQIKYHITWGDGAELTEY